MSKKRFTINSAGALLACLFVNNVYSHDYSERNVLFSTNSITIADRACIRGAIYSNNFVQFGIEAVQHGSVKCAGNVSLLDRCNIYGSITYKGIITLAPQSYIEGEIVKQDIVEQTIPAYSGLFGTRFRRYPAP